MKKILSIWMILAVMAVMAMPCTVFGAEKKINVNVMISVGGEIKIANEQTSVTDKNKNGKIDIDDTMITVHEKYGKGYESKDSGWGLGIEKLWGDSSGAYGYYVNDEMVSTNLEEEVKEGDYIAVYSFKDTTGFSDVYSYFTEKAVGCKEGDTVELTLMKKTFDANWNVVTAPFSGATIKEGNNILGETDEEGKITIKAHKGNYIVTATKDEITIVPPVCVFSVSKVETKPEKEDEDKPKEDAGKVKEEKKDSKDKETEIRKEVKDETISTPKTGEDNSMLIWEALFLMSVVTIGVIIFGKRKEER